MPQRPSIADRDHNDDERVRDYFNNQKAMRAALHSQPKFSELFMAYLLARNSRVEEDLIDQLFNSSKSGSRAFCYCSRISARKAYVGQI
jgi:hypothetical protein